MSNLAECLSGSASAHTNEIALIADDGPHTYADLRETVAGVAGGLRSLGVEADTAVAYQVSNGPVATVLYYAILATGGIAVPINPLLSPEETAVIRSRTNAALLLSENSASDPDIEVPHPGALEVLPRGERRAVAARSECDPAVVFFTSGTTGAPKGIVLTHGNLRSNAEWVVTESLAPDAWGPGHVTAAVLPLSHSFAMTCAQNAALLSGAALTYQASFEPADLLARIRRAGVTSVALVPAAAKRLFEAWQDRPDHVPLEYCLIGGAPIPPPLVEAIEDAMGVSVLEGYGLTETSPVCAFRTPSTPRKPGSVGRAAGYARLAVESGDGRIVPAGEGELLVCGPGVTSTYVGGERPDTVDGWLRTGDVARIDEAGHVFLIDRKKDLIIHNGYNVSPAEVERVLIEIPGVRDAGVVGIPDESAGEEVVAFVVAREVTESDILEACARRLAAYKRPRVIRWIDEVPRGQKGQVLRHRLRMES